MTKRVNGLEQTWGCIPDNIKNVTGLPADNQYDTGYRSQT